MPLPPDDSTNRFRDVSAGFRPLPWLLELPLVTPSDRGSENTSAVSGLAFKAAPIGPPVAPDLTDDRDDAQGTRPEDLLEFLSQHRHSRQRRRKRSHQLGKSRLTFAILLAILVAFALVAVNFLISGDSVHHPRPVSHLPPAAHQSHATTPSDGGQTDSAPPHSAGGRKPKPKQPKPSPPKLVRLRLTAVRNDSWVQVRKGSSTGPVLFDGIVLTGQSIRVLGRPRLWARFGSLGNFDLTINGRPVRPTFNGTVDTVITASAIKPASTSAG
jgi:hypothetical protein